MIRELFAEIVAALGRRPRHEIERRDESAPALVDPGELRELAVLSRRSTREKVEFMPPGTKLTGFTLQDVDPATGKFFVDYLERRAAREAAAKPEDKLAGVLKHDCHPDD